MDGVEEVSYARMATAYPVRTAIFTVGPVVFALVQLVNGYFHGVSLPYVGVFVALLLAFSVHVNRYHLAVFRRRVVAGPRETFD